MNLLIILLKSLLKFKELFKLKILSINNIRFFLFLVIFYINFIFNLLLYEIKLNRRNAKNRNCFILNFIKEMNFSTAIIITKKIKINLKSKYKIFWKFKYFIIEI